MSEATRPGKLFRSLPLDAEAVLHVPGSDEHHDDRLRILVAAQRLDRVESHRRVPRALCVEHGLPRGVVHAGVKSFFAEGRLEEAEVVGVLRVDLRRNVSGLLRRQAREALLAHRRDDLPWSIDGEERKAAVPGEEEDVAVVEPVVAPAPVPPRGLQELLLGEPAGRPVLEGRLRGVRVHLEADRDLPPGAHELLEDAPLDAVRVHVGVALSDQEQPHAFEPPRQLRRRRARLPSRVSVIASSTTGASRSRRAGSPIGRR